MCVSDSELGEKYCIPEYHSEHRTINPLTSRQLAAPTAHEQLNCWSWRCAAALVTVPGCRSPGAVARADLSCTIAQCPNTGSSVHQRHEHYSLILKRSDAKNTVLPCVPDSTVLQRPASVTRIWQQSASVTQFCPDYYFGSRVLQRQYSATLIWQSASATEFCHAYLTECFSDPIPGHDYLTAECFSDNILPCSSDRVLQRPNSAMLIWKSASVTQFCHAYLTECFSDPIPGHDYLTAEYFSNNILPCLIDRVLQRPISAMLIWQSASATQFCHAYLTECVSDAVLPRLSDRVRQLRSSAMFIWQNASVTQFGHAYLTECFSDPIRPWVFDSRVLQQLSSATCIRQWVLQWPSSAVQIWQQSAPKIQLWNTDLTEECFIDKILHFSVSVQFLKHYSSTFIWQRFNISLLFWQQSVSRTQFCNSQ